MAVINLTFRYRGIIDFERFYKEGMAYWMSITDPDDINEKKHKDKGKEFEGVWAIQHKLDAYFMATYEVDYKAVDMNPTTIVIDGKEKKVFDGKIRIYIEGDLVQHYEQTTISDPGDDKVAIFKEGGFLHKMFSMFIKRRAEEDLEDVVVQTAHGFINLVKDICKMEAQDG